VVKLEFERRRMRLHWSEMTDVHSARGPVWGIPPIFPGLLHLSSLPTAAAPFYSFLFIVDVGSTTLPHTPPPDHSHPFQSILAILGDMTTKTGMHMDMDIEKEMEIDGDGVVDTDTVHVTPSLQCLEIWVSKHRWEWAASFLFWSQSSSLLIFVNSIIVVLLWILTVGFIKLSMAHLMNWLPIQTPPNGSIIVCGTWTCCSLTILRSISSLMAPIFQQKPKQSNLAHLLDQRILS
jgi:hypothetical protein